MNIGIGIALAAIGAILVWGVTASVAGISINVVGFILMIAGVVAIGLGLAALGRDRTTGDPTVR